MDDTDRDILRLAAQHYRFEANREQDALTRFGLGAVAFAQRVNALLDDPAAAVGEPQIVARLRRLRDRQRHVRRAS